MRGFRSKANYYSYADDVKIIEFIIKNRRFHEVGGNALWDTMEKRGDLPGRSWNSLKERFRKVIIKKIGSYDLSEETVNQFLTKGRAERLNTI